jgi:hypothetical protein
MQKLQQETHNEGVFKFLRLKTTFSLDSILKFSEQPNITCFSGGCGCGAGKNLIRKNAINLQAEKCI